MPMPAPRSGESRQDFVSRFMSDEDMKKEFPKQKQRLAVAFQKWRDAQGEKSIDPIIDGLIQSMAEELKAAETYEDRAQMVAADKNLLAVYAHIIQEEYEHFDEFVSALNGDLPVSSSELEVRFVGPDVLLDYKGMNPAFAKLIKFSGCADNEILCLQGMSDEETQKTINHERQEYDMLMSGIPYWPAHKKLMQEEEPETMKYKDAKRLMAVKFVDEDKGIIEGIYAPFGGPLGGKDLQNEYFDKTTDFCEKWFPGGRPILYHHGMDESVKAEVIGHDIATKVLDNGRWLQAQLDKSVKYWKEIKQLILDGRMFFSSGAVPHLVEKAVDGKLLRWPWVETSLTVSPANPMATVDSIKAIEVLKAVGATDEQLKNIIQEIKDAPIVDLTNNKEAKNMGQEATKSKSVKVQCPKCKAEFDYTMPEAAGTPAPVDPGTEHAPAGDKQPPATNPGVNQGMAPETHVATTTTESAGQSGQHGGSTPAPEKPEGDRTAGKGETPKPAATVSVKEPEPPAATTQASDNTASSTGTPPGKSIETEDKSSAAVKVEISADKAVEAIKAQTDGLKAMLAEHLKSVEGSVKEAVKPLEDRIKALENQPADSGPIRRAPNSANPLEDESSSSLKRMFDDPATPQAVKAYIGEQLAAKEVSDMIAKGPQRIGRKVIAEK